LFSGFLNMDNDTSNPEQNETQLANTAVQEQEPHRGQQVTQINSDVVPNDYLYWSIFNTICCAIFLGAIAIVYSVKTRESIKNHDLANAQKQSSVAFKMNLVA
jgi:hypothetical protein